MYKHKYQIMKWPLVLFVLSLLFIANDGFALVLRQTVEELTVKAERILIGEVTEIKNEWNEERTTIYTYVTVLVEQDIKGSSNKKEVVIRVPGGKVGDMTLKVSDVPQFRLKEKTMVFLESDKPTYFRVSGWFQGKFTIKNNKVIEKKMQLRDFIGQIQGIMKNHGIQLQEGISPTKSMKEKPSTLQKHPIHSYNKEIGNMIKKNIKREEQLSFTSETGWITIMSEDFESDFPSTGWIVGDGGYYTGEYYWGKDDYKPHGESYSAWCAKSGANGLDPEFNNYPNYCESVAMYGPFDLSDATQADITLKLWLESEPYYDGITFLISIDGANWYVEDSYSGYSGGWISLSYDFANTINLGDVTGQPAVGIAAVFTSDDIYTYRGAFIDDIVLRKYVPESPPPLPVINNISPNSGSAGTGTSVTISGSNFGSQDTNSSVTFFYMGSQRISANITSWSDTSIQCTVPAEASSGDVRVTTSAGTSNNVQFTVTFGYGGAKWYDFDIPVPYYINGSGTPDCANEFIAIQNALQTWQDVSDAYMDFAYVGTISKIGSNYDGYNVISWDSLADAIAVNAFWILGDQVLDSDIIFNNSLQWSDSGEAGKYDVQNVATHELGHSLYLTDLYGSADAEKTMYGYGNPGETKARTLEPEDEQGIIYIYGGPPIVCSVSGIVFDSSSNPAEGVRVEYDSLTSEFWKDVYTNVDGTFTLTGLPSGLGSIQAKPEISTGYAWSIDSPCNYIHLSPGENRTGYLAILEESALVSGYMKDSIGNPLANFDEWYYNGKATGGWGDYTDGSGRYEIRLPFGTYWIYLETNPDDFYRAVPRQITVTDTTQHISVPDIIAYTSTDGTTISGDVNNPSGFSKTGIFIVGALEAGTVVDAETIYGINPINIVPLDSADPFILDSLTPRINYDVFLAVVNIEPNGLYSYTVRDYQDNISGGTTGISLDYTSEGSTVTGNVTNGANGILGAYVVVTEQNTGKCAGITLTGQDGDYTLYNMAPGDYIIEATHSKYGKSAIAVTVTEGIPATVPTIILLYDIVINEFLPNPDGSNVEWVELYNKGTVSIDIGGCYIDDIIGSGGSPIEIPASTIIKAKGYYSLIIYNGDGYLNNTGDTANLLMPDGITVIDSKSYDDVAAYPDFSIYRYPDGEGWTLDMDNTPTKNSANDGPVEKGDINIDGRINSADAILCLRFAVGLDEPTPAQRYIADMNDDDRINSADAIKILRKAVGLE